MSDKAIRQGGLFRCCIQSIFDYKGEEIPGKTVIGCKYHNADEPTAILADDDVWEWIDANDKRKK